MENWLARTRLLLGEEAVETLRHSRVAVLGLGGVGGAAAEAICRSGVGAMLLADYDKVDITNLNRQLIAVSSTVGQGTRPETATRRLRDINPELDLTLRDGRLAPENLPEVLDWQPDYILDCIDNVTAKLALTVLCREQGVKLITCLGTGNRHGPVPAPGGEPPGHRRHRLPPLPHHAQGAAPPGHHRPHRGLLAGGAGGARRCSRRGQRTPPTGQHGLCTSGRRLPDGLPCGAGSAGPAAPCRTLNCYTDSNCLSPL